MSNLKEAVNKDGSSASVVAKIVRYENCCKNHGARSGKYATDGCMEFMAKITDALVCDACGCHRNFHKKKVVEDGDRGESEVRYEDCCKNHAIRLGEYSSKDGCLEFMAIEGGGEAGGSKAELTCDACGCHRNFHKRKEEKVVRKRSPPASYGGGSSAYDSDHYYD